MIRTHSSFYDIGSTFADDPRAPLELCLCCRTGRRGGRLALVPLCLCRSHFQALTVPVAAPKIFVLGEASDRYARCGAVLEYSRVSGSISPPARPKSQSRCRCIKQPLMHMDWLSPQSGSAHVPRDGGIFSALLIMCMLVIAAQAREMARRQRRR